MSLYAVTSFTRSFFFLASADIFRWFSTSETQNDEQTVAGEKNGSTRSFFSTNDPTILQPYRCKNGRVAQKEPGGWNPWTLEVWRGGCTSCRPLRGCSPWWPTPVQEWHTSIMCVKQQQPAGTCQTGGRWLLTEMWAFPFTKLNWGLLVLPSKRGRFLLFPLEFFMETVTFPSRSCPAGFPYESCDQSGSKSAHKQPNCSGSVALLWHTTLPRSSESYCPPRFGWPWLYWRKQLEVVAARQAPVSQVDWPPRLR